MSSLRHGRETNAGLAYRLVQAALPLGQISLRYEAGVQWTGWRDAFNVIEGRGINRQIRRVYGALASRYQPGDRIFLFGYSRGAYAVRSLAGLIDRVGLLTATDATERNVREAYRLYQSSASEATRAGFAKVHCHSDVTIEMIGVWDTVKALGLRAPIIWRFSETKHHFHNHHLSRVVKNGYHALAFHETRNAYAPVLWASDADWSGTVVQMWFRGTHGDVGGQISGFHRARPLSNIPFVWMMEHAEDLGLSLPPGWKASYPQDASAPSIGTMRGAAKLFLSRRRRTVGADPSEQLHPTLDAALSGSS